MGMAWWKSLLTWKNLHSIVSKQEVDNCLVLVAALINSHNLKLKSQPPLTEQSDQPKPCNASYSKSNTETAKGNIT